VGTAPLVYIIVLTWNGKADTVECLRSLRSLTYPKAKVLVVDNASADGTAEALRSEFPEVELIVNASNLRFAGGNNAGIRYALGKGADYVCLLNNDTVADPGLLSHLVAAAESTAGAGMAGPRIYYYPERNRLWYAGGRIDWKRGWIWHVGVREEDEGQYNQPGETDFVSGCCMLVKRDVIEMTGMLDEAYYIYGEDVDWCVRAARAGFKILYAPEGKLWHKLSVSAGGHFSWFKNWNKFRSQLRLMARYAPASTLAALPFWMTVNVLLSYVRAKRGR
jgi:GT2 family glycosyltransferase